jgi:RND family efflux transporter MFP subunit
MLIIHTPANAGARARPPLGSRLGLALLATIALAAGCDRSADENTFVPPPPPEVIVATPVEREVVGYMTFTGVIEASESVQLRARVQGFLESMHYSPGQRVKKGDVLFVIDKRQYEADVAQAEAAVQSQQAALVGAENDARLARELADQRAGPEIDAIIKTARRDAVKAELARAEAILAEAKLNLEYCEVVAPIDGRISRNYVDVGNLVGRGDPTLLADIVQATPCFVSLDVSESDVLKVKRERQESGKGAPDEPGQVSPGQWRPCELALSDETEFAIKGRVDYVDPMLNPDTGTLRVRTRFENADEILLPGLFARVRFAMSTSNAMVVPEAALLTDQQGRFALVVNEQNEVEARRVRIGLLDGQMRVVEEGLNADDRVIVLGVLKARPGSKVTPKMQALAPAAEE